MQVCALRENPRLLRHNDKNKTDHVLSIDYFFEIVFEFHPNSGDDTHTKTLSLFMIESRMVVNRLLYILKIYFGTIAIFFL